MAVGDAPLLLYLDLFYQVQGAYSMREIELQVLRVQSIVRLGMIDWVQTHVISETLSAKPPKLTAAASSHQPNTALPEGGNPVDDEYKK